MIEPCPEQKQFMENLGFVRVNPTNSTYIEWEFKYIKGMRRSLSPYVKTPYQIEVSDLILEAYRLGVEETQNKIKKALGL